MYLISQGDFQYFPITYTIIYYCGLHNSISNNYGLISHLTLYISQSWPFSMWCSLVVWAALPLLAATNYISRDEEELLNWCIKSNHHKTKPGPESSLYDQASDVKE